MNKLPLRHQISWLAFIQLITITIAIAYLPNITSFMQQKIIRSRAIIIQQIEDTYKVRLSYASLIQTFFNHLKVNNLYLQLDDGSQIYISKILVNYNWGAIFRPESTIINSISLEESRIRLKLPATTSDQAQIAFPDLPFRLLFINTNFSWSGKQGQGEISNLMLNLSPTSRGLKLNSSGKLTTSLGNDNYLVQTHFRSYGYIAASNNNLQATIDLTKGQLNNFYFKDISLQIDYSPTAIQLWNRSQEQQLDLFISYQQQQLELNAFFENLRYRDFIIQSPLNLPESFYQQSLNGSFSINSDKHVPLYYSFDIDTQASQQLLRAKGSGDNEQVTFDQLALDWSAKLKFWYQGQFFYQSLQPQGLVNLLWQSEELNQQVRASIDVAIIDPKTTTLNSSAISLGKQHGFTVNSTLKQLDQGHRLFSWQVSSSYLQQPLLNFTARLSPYDEQLMLLHFTTPTDGWNLAYFQQFFPLKLTALLDSIQLQMQGSLRISKSSYDLNISELKLNSKNRFIFSSSLRLQAQSITLNNLRFTVADNLTGIDTLLSGSLDGQLTQGYFSGLLFGQDLLLQWYKIDNVLYLKSQQLNAQLSSKNLSFKINQLQLPLKSRPFASISSQIKLTLKPDWQVKFLDTEIELQSQNKYLPKKLSFNGLLNQQSFDIEDLQWRQLGVNLSGKALIQQQQGQNFIFNLQVSKEDEKLQLDGNYLNKQLDLNTQIAVNINRFTNNAADNGLLRSSFQLQQGEGLQINGSMNLKPAIISLRPSQFNLRFLYRDGDLAISKAKMRYGNAEVTRAIISYNQLAQQLLVNLGYRFNHSSEQLNGALSAKIQRRDQLNNLAAFAAPLNGSYRGQLNFSSLNSSQQEVLPSFQLALTQLDGKLDINSEEPDKFELNYNNNNGKFHFLLGSVFPVHFKLDGDYQKNRISALLSDIFIDATLLNFLAPIDANLKQAIFHLESGDLSGNLLVTGSPFDPKFTGNIQANDIITTSPYLTSSPEPINLNLQAQEHVILLQPTTINFTRSQLFIPGNEQNYFRLRNFFPDRYYMKFKVSGQGLPATYKVGTLAMNGLVTGELLASGGQQESYIDGDITFESLKIIANLSRNNDQLSARENIGKQKLSHRLNLALRMRTGKNVVFYMPDERTPIIEAEGQLGDLISLNYDTVDNSGSLVGSIRFPLAKIGSANIGYSSEGSGLIVFDENLPAFDPLINFNSQTSVLNRQGLPITISLSYQGQIRDLLNEGQFPAITSSPEISEDEAKILLLSQNFNQGGDANAVSLLPSLLLQLGENEAWRTLTTMLQESLPIVDRIDIQTHILKNVYLEQQAASSELTSVDPSYERYFDDMRISFSFYADDNILFSGGVRTNYNPFEKGGLAIKGLQIIPELGLTFITPFVTISTQIGLRNFDKLAVPESSFNINWAFKF